MKNIITFGKYEGKIFNYVFKKDKDYCHWFLQNLDYENATYDRKQFYEYLRSQYI